MTHFSDLVSTELISELLNFASYFNLFFRDIYSFLGVADHGHLNTSSKVPD